MYEEIGARIRGSTSWWGWGYPQFFVPGGPHPQAVYMHRAWRSLELVLNGGSPKREITLGCIGRAGVGRAVVGRPVVGSSGGIGGTRPGRGHPGGMVVLFGVGNLEILNLEILKILKSRKPG